MDTLRGNFDSSDISDDSRDYDVTDEDTGRDVPPPSIGQDERRMQVRAYNFWAGMLDDRNYPSIEELDPASIEDFGPYSVLLDFSVGIEDPAVQFLGEELGRECGSDSEIRKLSDVPARSLLSRITDHYMQILANQAPIGFEAEFVNQRGNTVLYRGILLPYSSDDETIDFIFGVINWKEMAEAAEADELLLEIDQALETGDADNDGDEPDTLELDQPLITAPVADWADGPAADSDDAAIEPIQTASPEVVDFDFSADDESSLEPAEGPSNVEPLDLSGLDLEDDARIDASSGLPTPSFGDYDLTYDEEDEEEDDANYDFASLTDHIKAPTKKALSLDLDMAADDDTDVSGEGEDGNGSPAIPSAYEPEGFTEEHDVHTVYTPDFTPEALSETDPDSSMDFGEEPLELSEDIVVDDETDEDFAETAEPAPLAEPQLAPVEQVEPSYEAEPVETAAPEISDPAELPEDAGLYDYLASARELAETARTREDRSRNALYAAVGRAYDFSLAAKAEPGEFEELLSENGLTAQDRAPMTPVVKLVFGADYDKTRLTEYAAVLSHAHRVGVERGSLSHFLSEAEGGLKGVVQAERRLRREEAGKSVEPVDAVRKALAKKLRKLEGSALSDIDPYGAEFSVVMLHRTADGEVVVLGEVADDIPLIERVGRKLVA